VADVNGPEHYAEAERLLTEAHEAAQRVLPVQASRPDAAAMYANVMARAQVHATLAQTAAALDVGYSVATSHLPNLDAWTEVLS
jgi:hypothetical protein